MDGNIYEVVAKQLQTAYLVVKRKGQEAHMPRPQWRPKSDGAYIYIIYDCMYVVVVEGHREGSAIDAKGGQYDYSRIYESLDSHLLSISDAKKATQGLYLLSPFITLHYP